MTAFMRTALMIEQAVETEREFVAGTAEVDRTTLIEVAWAHDYLNTFGENSEGLLGVWF